MAYIELPSGDPNYYFYIRPDARDALRDPVVRRVFPRYVAILERRTYPKFMICRSIPVEFREDEPLEELWKVHDEAMKEYYEVEKRVDEGWRGFLEKRPEKSLLDLKIAIAEKLVRKCCLCERRCGVDRFAGQKGYCRGGYRMRVSTAFMHLGEEHFITPSWTVFTCGCNFTCLYCQNWTISQWFESGEEVDYDILAGHVDYAYLCGARNLNMVGGDPTIWLHEWLKVIKRLKQPIPTFFNTNGYYSVESAKLMEGVMDIIKIDFRYGNDACAERLSKVKNYWSVLTRNTLHATQHHEVLIRHLVLPNHIECCSKPVLKWIAENVKERVIVNIMDQYRPEYRVYEDDDAKDVRRRVTISEFKEVVQYAESLGIYYIT